MIPHTHKEEFALQQLSAAFTNIPFNKTLGLQLVSLSKDQVEIKFSMKEILIGNFLQSILHGGVISSVLDMAGGMVVMGAAIHGYLSHHKEVSISYEALAEVVSKISTVNLNINFISPGKGDFFITKAKLNKKGKKISFAQMEMLNHESLLIANGTGAYSMG